MQEQDIKSLNPIDCPHCRKPIIIEVVTRAPQLTGIYTPEMLNDAKNEAIEKIKKLGLPEETTRSTIDWINSPDTIFSPADVEEILKNIQR